MYRMILSATLALSVLLCVPAWPQPAEGAWDAVPMTALRAGVAEVDITPEKPVVLAGYAERTGPSTGIHDPLKASVIVFDDGQFRAAIVGLDAIQMLQFWGDAIRAAVEKETGIPGDHVILNASHTHGAPHPMKEKEYAQMVVTKVTAAVKQAVESLRPVSLGYGEGTIDFNINRRTVGENGKATGDLNPDGICDRRVKVLRIDDGNSIEPMAVIIHVVCHPNVFRGANTQISGDFAGLGREFLEKNFNCKAVGVVLQGCCGDIRSNMPPVGGEWRSGSAADMTWCAVSFGAEALRMAARLRVREQVVTRPKEFAIRAAEDTLYLDVDPAKKEQIEQYKDKFRDRIENGKIVFPIRAVAIGDFVFVGLPGEPVVEYGLGIEKDLAMLGKTVFVLGYCTGDAGYVPASHMIDEGGYEAQGPYNYDSEALIRDGVKRLVESLLAK